ncbi:MAG: hypothetical protein ACE15C_13340 [Phycisphaerae bacterium]
MSVVAKDLPTDSNAEQSDATGAPLGADGVRNAMDELRRAADSRQIEPICAAYIALRKRCAGMKVRELFDRVEQALGPMGKAVVISAFSHRRCFMCTGGTMACDQCDETGLAAPGRICPGCDGFGVVPCTFCQGTGWADREVVPEEIKRAVADRHVLHVKSEWSRLKAENEGFSAQKLAKLTFGQRRRLGTWLIRLQSRMNALGQSEEVAETSDRDELTAAIAEIDLLLGSLSALNREG